MLSVIRRASDVKTQVADWKSTGRKIGFVPTMGGLHDGHGSLIRASLEECDRTIVSVFLNPLQFEHESDLETYPHDEKLDINFCADLGANAVFYPSVDEMYPTKPITIVTQSGLTDHLDGAARPGFFDGILTVVTKLFHMVAPDVAYFGQKDYQQVCVVTRLVQDLNFDIEIRSMPTAREKDGLAMASRNNLLTKTGREVAPKIYAGMKQLRQSFLAGEKSTDRLLGTLNRALEDIPQSRVDYASIVDPQTLALRKGDINPGDVLAVAVFVGEVRMIDNIILDNDPWAHR